MVRHSPILSDLELQILGLIRQQPRSGYDLRKALSSSPGSVYPALHRLAAAGLIEGRSEGARKKATFQLTNAGRRALRTALERPVIDEMRRDPQAVAARLRFLEPGGAVAFLEEYARLSSECASELKERSGLVAEHDAELYAARARWAVAAAKRLRAQNA